MEVGTGTTGTKIIRRDWPNTSGLEAGTTKQEGRISNLVPEQGSLVPEKNRKGI